MPPILDTVKINGYVEDEVKNEQDSIEEKLCNMSLMNCENSQCSELASCDSIKIPENFAQMFADVLTLNFENRQLQSFPSSITSIEKLQTLKLNDNKITKLPSRLENFKSLSTLDLSKNQIKELPENFGELISLETLHLGWNKLSKLPSSSVKLSRLVSLNLCNNNLCRIPNSVTSGMKSLEFLDTSSNPKMAIHHAPSSIQLKTFVAKNNKKCPLFPTWILNYKYQNLETVILDESEFAFFDVLNVENLPVKIKNFSMRQSNLTDKLLSWVMKNMNQLESLNAGNDVNGGNVVPEIKLESDSVLKEINFENIGLSTFPDFSGNFCNITKVNVSCNNITWFPEELANLRNLEILVAQQCQLISLPDDFGELGSLKELHVAKNGLTFLPDSMKKMKNLEMVDLYDNQLDEIPKVLGELENLKALDLGQNFFDTQDLEVGGKLVANLELVLRNEKNQCEARVFGFKISVQEDSDSSFSSENSYDSRFETNNCCIVSTAESGDLCPDENWDESYDSTDDFDPNVPKIPRNRNSSVKQPTLLEKQNFMLPALYHEKSVVENIKLQCVLGDRDSEYVEGQFDDAEGQFDDG